MPWGHVQLCTSRVMTVQCYTSAIAVLGTADARCACVLCSRQSSADCVLPLQSGMFVLLGLEPDDACFGCSSATGAALLWPCQLLTQAYLHTDLHPL